MQQKTAQELIQFKLTHISKSINYIIAKWNQDNSDDFIQKVKSGEIPNAEMDAISLRQLEADYLKYSTLLQSVQEENDG